MDVTQDLDCRKVTMGWPKTRTVAQHHGDTQVQQPF
jgi:hypothetical protein